MFNCVIGNSSSGIWAHKSHLATIIPSDSAIMLSKSHNASLVSILAIILIFSHHFSFKNSLNAFISLAVLINDAAIRLIQCHIPRTMSVLSLSQIKGNLGLYHSKFSVLLIQIIHPFIVLHVIVHDLLEIISSIILLSSINIFHLLGASLISS